MKKKAAAAGGKYSTMQQCAWSDQIWTNLSNLFCHCLIIVLLNIHDTMHLMKKKECPEDERRQRNSWLKAKCLEEEKKTPPNSSECHVTASWITIFVRRTKTVYLLDVCGDHSSGSINLEICFETPKEDGKTKKNKHFVLFKNDRLLSPPHPCLQTRALYLCVSRLSRHQFVW